MFWCGCMAYNNNNTYSRLLLFYAMPAQTVVQPFHTVISMTILRNKTEILFYFRSSQ